MVPYCECVTGGVGAAGEAVSRRGRERERERESERASERELARGPLLSDPCLSMPFVSSRWALGWAGTRCVGWLLRVFVSVPRERVDLLFVLSCCAQIRGAVLSASIVNRDQFRSIKLAFECWIIRDLLGLGSTFINGAPFSPSLVGEVIPWGKRNERFIAFS